MAEINEGRLLPKTMTNVAAKAIPGNDMMMSRIRMMTSEIHLRETAASEPMIEPHTSANAVAPRPMVSGNRAIHHARKNVATLVVGTEEEFPHPEP